jgi:hypothetical protein
MPDKRLTIKQIEGNLWVQANQNVSLVGLLTDELIANSPENEAVATVKKGIGSPKMKKTEQGSISNFI